MLHQITGTLTATPSFDFAQSLRFIGGFEPMGGEQAIANLSLTKGAWIGDQPVAFHMRLRTNANQTAQARPEPLTARHHATHHPHPGFQLSGLSHQPTISQVVPKHTQSAQAD